MDRTPSGATTTDLNWPGSDSKTCVLCITQISGITGTSPSDCLVSYPEYSLGKSYLSTDMQLVYSAASADGGILLD